MIHHMQVQYIEQQINHFSSFSCMYVSFDISHLNKVFLMENTPIMLERVELQFDEIE